MIIENNFGGNTRIVISATPASAPDSSSVSTSVSHSAPRTLVLLTLNEIEGITALHPSIPYDCADEVFVVDGGSRDGTREFFENHGILVLDRSSDKEIIW